MKRTAPLALAATLAAAAVLAAATPARAADVGVSIGISQPGVYGRIDIGRFPQPELVLAAPVIVTRTRVAPPEPVYLWVPPGHRHNWRRHCAAYHACGVPVYFVRDEWYGQHVHPHGPGRGRGQDRGWDDRGGPRGGEHGHDRGPDRDHDRGRGNGEGPRGN
jgi:hypothetical protein